MDKAYIEVVRLLLEIAPAIFETPDFAMKGGTAINLFIEDMPRLSVDIDVVFIDYQATRDKALKSISTALETARKRLAKTGIEAEVSSTKDGDEIKLFIRRGRNQVKVEVNHVFRGTVLPVETRRIGEAARKLFNASKRKDAASDATIVGCQWTEGRWPDKRALEFRGVSDRVRLSVPGEYESLTLAAWVRVQGLDRQINSLFMSDGFEDGTVHWSIRHDGVLGLTAIGSEPGRYQICASPSALTLNQFGLWTHLAVVIDGGAKRVSHYLNGAPVSEHALKISPPFRVGVAELGNWNAQGFPRNDPFMIRNFSGAMDEFCLFSRALNADEIRALHSAGKPQPDPLIQTRN